MVDIAAAVASLRRPYRVTWPMVALMALVPLYLFIPRFTFDQTMHAPAIALDRRIPLEPGWVLVYGPLYLFLILLPLFVIRTDALIRRTFYAYLAVWMSAYVCFWLYPTSAPRPDDVPAGGAFAAWGLRFLYSADPPFNCFPSLHVAHSFVSALCCRRVHRGLGNWALAAAGLVGLSTLFTKQHYVLDVVAGALLAAGVCTVALRGVHRGATPDFDRRAAPALALIVAAMVALVFSGYVILYALGVEV